MNQFYIQIDNTKSGLMDLAMTRQLLADILREARRMREPIKRRGPGRFEYLIWNHEVCEYNRIGYKQHYE